MPFEFRPVKCNRPGLLCMRMVLIMPGPSTGFFHEHPFLVVNIDPLLEFDLVGLDEYLRPDVLEFLQ